MMSARASATPKAGGIPARVRLRSAFSSFFWLVVEGHCGSAHCQLSARVVYHSVMSLDRVIWGESLFIGSDQEPGS